MARASAPPGLDFLGRRSGRMAAGFGSVAERARHVTVSLPSPSPLPPRAPASTYNLKCATHTPPPTSQRAGSIWRCRAGRDSDWLAAPYPSTARVRLLPGINETVNGLISLPTQNHHGVNASWVMRAPCIVRTISASRPGVIMQSTRDCPRLGLRALNDSILTRWGRAVFGTCWTSILARRIIPIVRTTPQHAPVWKGHCDPVFTASTRRLSSARWRQSTFAGVPVPAEPGARHPGFHGGATVVNERGMRAPQLRIIRSAPYRNVIPSPGSTVTTQ